MHCLLTYSQRSWKLLLSLVCWMIHFIIRSHIVVGFKFLESNFIDYVVSKKKVILVCLLINSSFTVGNTWNSRVLTIETKLAWMYSFAFMRRSSSIAKRRVPNRIKLDRIKFQRICSYFSRRKRKIEWISVFFKKNK